MADNVRYDDFVSKVQADPANPQSSIMLQGYVGRGPDGHIRIYPDPALGNWYDVPEGDIVHSMPLEDSKLGGSYIWVKSSAAIKPGGATAAASQAGAGLAAAAAPVAPAPQLLPTPQTHCFICPPHTQPPQCPVLSVHCPSSPVLCDIHPSLGIACTVVNCHTPPAICNVPQSLHCPSSPIFCDTMPRTIATVCTQVACPTHPPGCPIPHLTQPGICPVLSNPAACGPQFTTPQLTTPQFGPGQLHPQAMAAMAAPAPAAAPIHPTPSAVQQCGQPAHTLGFFCSHPLVCNIHTAHQCPSVQVICPTPTVSNHVFCQQSLGIGCLQTAAAPCPPVTFGVCSVQCLTPQFTTPQLTTPIQNGIFTPFGR